ncbi:sensor histidine kinase [Trinickia dabaoshanensis]|uniref:histidine kinase n=1 Tax=Trinickia dabaoshanensis TaxID=564714 RepID=A0A2N7VX45_9BURK|nr:sensor histidine kinase [Trinickia dabaoshanensis]PMS21713.1 sensor histidine kinase [Trinickia dabaoshanensis]
MNELTTDTRVFLSILAPDRRERQLAIVVALITAVAFVSVVPFAKIQLPTVWAFIPVYESAAIVCDFLTAALLIGQYRILRSKALLVLATGYWLTAFTATAHLLTFPGVFSATGWLGARGQSTAWLYVFWHGSFPLFVIAYAWLKGDDVAPRTLRERACAPAILASFAFAALLAIGFALLATRGYAWLPPQLSGPPLAPSYTAAHGIVLTVTWLLSLLALVALFRRRPHSVLDLWLMIVTCASLFDVAFAGVLNHGRFDLGFYAGRAFSLCAASFVLVVLTLENMNLYARVVQALEGERSERQRTQLQTARLNEANALLEQRVASRTAALTAANHHLVNEVLERKRAEAALEHSREELRELASIGTSAREQENRRIARELHDELCQTLAASRLALELVSERNELKAELAPVHSLLDEAVVATRRIAADLRPLVLDDLGLVAAADWLAQNFRQRHGIECELSVEPPDLDLDEPQATAVFRIMQESLNNIGRHAHASRARVSLMRHDDHVLLIVQDNGAGFDLSTPRKLNSFGLSGLRERAYLVAGEVAIESSPGYGTSIKVRIPLPVSRVPATRDAAVFPPEAPTAASPG